MGSAISRTNKKKCGTIEDAEKIRIDSSPLHCPICLLIYQKAPEILPCGHSHCSDCLDRLEQHSLRVNQDGNTVRLPTIECPLCRTRIRVQRQRVKNYAIEAILDSMQAYDPEEDPTNEIIAALNCSIKRLSLQNNELERKIHVLATQLLTYKQYGLGILSLMTVGIICLLLRSYFQY